jgi:hypothetical protein
MDSLSGVKVSINSACIIKEILKYKEEKQRKEQEKEMFFEEKSKELKRTK